MPTIKKVMHKKFLLASLIFFIQMAIFAQITPGQLRYEVEKQAGPMLWESAPAYPGKGLHLVLHRGSVHTQKSPVLCVYVQRKLLFPIFFVSQHAFLRAMHRLQADPSMTQVDPTPYTLTFLSEGKKTGFLLSDAMAKDKELFKEFINNNNVLRFIPKNQCYAIVHVDYDIVKSLGYGATFTK